MLDGDAADGYVTPDGALVTCASSQGKVRIADPRKGHSPPSLPGTTCVMAGRDGTVAVAGLGDDPDGGIPLAGLLVVTESGDAVLPRLDDTVDELVSLVVTAAGTTLVTDLDGEVVLVDDDGDEVAYPDVRLGQALVAGDRVYATSSLENKGPLLVSDDDGVSWQETALPGMESSEGDKALAGFPACRTPPP